MSAFRLRVWASIAVAGSLTRATVLGVQTVQQGRPWPAPVLGLVMAALLLNVFILPRGRQAALRKDS